MTISAAIRDCLDDIHWDANDLAQCVCDKGIITARGYKMPLPDVQSEIAYILAHNSCTFRNTERAQLLDHIAACLVPSDPIHVATLTFWLGLLHLNPFLNP